MIYQEWKPLLQAFVQLQNKTNMSYSPDVDALPIRDLEYARNQSRRLRQVKEQHRLRSITPIQHEVRAKIKQVEANTRSVQVTIHIIHRFKYEMKGRPYEESQCFDQRIKLNKENSGWVLARIECPVPERHTSSEIQAPNHLSLHTASAPMKQHSKPLIHRQVYSAQPYDVSQRKQLYHRQKARRYADQWWDSSNPEFMAFDVDCTNYVSQCLYAGGAPMHYTGKREQGWWYKGKVQGREQWSFSWSVSHSLKIHLETSKSGLRAREVKDPSHLDIGDVIIYDWDGDGRFQHSVIVTAKDAADMPLVNAHTTNSYHRYWDYRDSYAWSSRTAYRFFHIEDEL